jgi:hypothetical protein
MNRAIEDEKLLRAQKAIGEALTAADALDWLYSHTDEQVEFEVALKRSGDADSGAPQAKKYLNISLQTFRSAIREQAVDLAKQDYEYARGLLKDG